MPTILEAAGAHAHLRHALPVTILVVVVLGLHVGISSDIFAEALVHDQQMVTIFGFPIGKSAHLGGGPNFALMSV